MLNKRICLIANDTYDINNKQLKKQIDSRDLYESASCAVLKPGSEPISFCQIFNPVPAQCRPLNDTSWAKTSLWLCILLSSPLNRLNQ